MHRHSESAKYQIANELGGIESLSAHYYHQNFSRHTHEGYTIGVIEQGAQRFLRNGANHLAPNNSIILVNHDEVHDGHSATEDGWAYRAIYPRVDQLQQVMKDAGLKHDGSVYFREPVVHDPELAELIHAALIQLQHSDNRLLRETLLYNALLQLIRRHSDIRPVPPTLSNAERRISLIRDFLNDQPEADVSLEELAKLAGVTAYHLVRQFQKQYGLPPHAYQIQSRIQLAQKLIQQGHSISDSAQMSGFHDQSHLHRHFKRTLGVTPGRYRNSLLAN